MKKLPKSKRLRFAIYVFHILLIIGVWAYNSNPEHIQGFAVFLGVTTIPLIAYILGDTYRPSNIDDINK